MTKDKKPKPGYQDPVSAMYMCANFDLRFGAWGAWAFSSGKDDFVFHECADVALQHISVVSIDGFSKVCGENGFLFVHPEDYKIFDPLNGDLGLDSSGRPCLFSSGGWALVAGGGALDLPVEIIRRNGKAFIWPVFRRVKASKKGASD